MKTNKFVLEDLTMVLEAIEKVRSEWIAKIDEKTKEYMEFHPEYSYDAAQKEIITCQECHEIHMRLVALYSCIGQGTEDYIGALKSTRRPGKGHLFVERRSKERKKAA